MITPVEAYYILRCSNEFLKLVRMVSRMLTKRRRTALPRPTRSRARAR